MGFYIRKSATVGPFRFNFSKSGIGVSTGIKGLRVGTGPRGNYITVGRGELYYRATLPSGSTRPTTSPPIQPGAYQPPASPQTVPGVGPMIAIESADVTAMQDSSSAELLNEINSKAQRPDYWKWSAAVSIAILWMMPKSESSNAFTFAFIVLALFTLYIGICDIVAKSVVLCYELDRQNEQAFEALHNAFAKISDCHKVWRIDAQGKVHDRKYHAGAGTLVTRKEVTWSRGLPPRVKCNLDVPFIKTPQTSLYFMPECILAYSSGGVGSIAYKDLKVYGNLQRFIEEGSVPGDAEVVDTTWRYVNKNGGPDRRFKDNRQLPIALYEEIHLQSNSGLNEVFQASRHSLSDGFNAATKAMAATLPA